MRLPANEAARALVRWQHAAGPYWPYVCAAPFLGAADTRPGRSEQGDTGLVNVLPVLPTGEQAAIFVDLPVSRTLPAAEQLAQLGFLVVPVIQRWVANAAALPCQDLVAQLLNGAPRRRRPAGRGVVFVLDGERAGASDPPSPRLFDNRYHYPVCRFPPPAFLIGHGIISVHWLPAAPVAEDLMPYAQLLAEEGLAPTVPGS